ncbi:hypothetical protein UlMin_033091 [Ulmus minor]
MEHSLGTCGIKIKLTQTARKCLVLSSFLLRPTNDIHCLKRLIISFKRKFHVKDQIIKPWSSQTFLHFADNSTFPSKRHVSSLCIQHPNVTTLGLLFPTKSSHLTLGFHIHRFKINFFLNDPRDLFFLSLSQISNLAAPSLLSTPPPLLPTCRLAYFQPPPHLLASRLDRLDLCDGSEPHRVGCSTARLLYRSDVLPKFSKVLEFILGRVFGLYIYEINLFAKHMPLISPANLSVIIPNATPKAIDLIMRLCSWDPSRGPTAEESLQHPFFHVIFWVLCSLQDPLELKLSNMGAMPNLELKLSDFCGEPEDCFLGLTLAIKPSVPSLDVSHKFHDSVFCAGLEDHREQSVFWSLIPPDRNGIHAPVESSFSLSFSSIQHPSMRGTHTRGFSSLSALQPANFLEGMFLGMSPSFPKRTCL